MTRTQINAILRDIRENQLPKWAELEDCNAHGEVLQATAEYFENKCSEYGLEHEKIAYYEMVEVIKTINRLHKERGSLYGALANIRSEVWNQLNRRIMVDFGEDIYLLVR